MHASSLLLCAASLAALPFAFSRAEKTGGPDKIASAEAVADMVDAAQAFLASLDDDQRALTVFAMKDDERKNWRFVPVERKGITLQQLRPEQDHLAYALLNSVMSNDGFRKAVSIMSLERILWELENRAERRNPERYHVLIFGEPSMQGSWGWRFEGHHFSCNVTVVDGRLVSVTPSMMGSNPGEVRSGPRKGLRVLGAEEDAGRALAKTLSDEQKKEAFLEGEVPADVLTAEKRAVAALSPAGIASSKFTAPQRELLWKVIGEYTGRFRPDLAAGVAARLNAGGDDKLTFAWSGNLEPGQPHYYRVQSPDFLFEYDNTQNNANHVHAVWRDFAGDFGEDILAQHLRDEHPAK